MDEPLDLAPEHRGEVGWSFQCEHGHHPRCLSNYYEPIMGQTVPCLCPCHYPESMTIRE